MKACEPRWFYSADHADVRIVVCQEGVGAMAVFELRGVQRCLFGGGNPQWTMMRGFWIRIGSAWLARLMMLHCVSPNPPYFVGRNTILDLYSSLTTYAICRAMHTGYVGL